MDTTSPPLSPIRQYMAPLETSPGYRDQLRRRTSSFSSHSDRSPVTPRSKHRFSHGSQMSNDFGASADYARGREGSSAGMGNLADELGQLDDDDEYEDDDGMLGDDTRDTLDKEVRDSGIDVSYTIKTTAAKDLSSPDHARSHSHSHNSPDGRPPDASHSSSPSARRNGTVDPDDLFTPDLEDLLTTVSRMTTHTTPSEDPLIPRAIAQLQDLGNQTSLEAATQRLTTSTNSLTAHLGAQSKTLHTLTQHTLSPLHQLLLSTPTASFSPLFADADFATDTLTALDALLAALPLPDPAPLQKLQRLSHETTDVRAALAQLTDTLQMGRQSTAAAARHLRATQAVVVELRRERERLDWARENMGGGIGDVGRGAREECRDVLDGFEKTCDGLRERLEGGVGVEVSG